MTGRAAGIFLSAVVVWTISVYAFIASLVLRLPLILLWVVGCLAVAGLVAASAVVLIGRYQAYRQLPVSADGTHQVIELADYQTTGKQDAAAS